MVHVLSVAGEANYVFFIWVFLVVEGLESNWAGVLRRVVSRIELQRSRVEEHVSDPDVLPLLLELPLP